MDKVADLQHVTLPKKGTELQVFFRRFVYILRAPTSRKTWKRKRTAILKFNAYYVTQGILLFIFRRCIYVWLNDGRPLIKIKLNRLINSVSSAINNKKTRYGKYSVKVHRRKYSTRDMETIWKNSILSNQWTPLVQKKLSAN